MFIFWMQILFFDCLNSLVLTTPVIETVDLGSILWSAKNLELFLFWLFIGAAFFRYVTAFFLVLIISSTDTLRKIRGKQVYFVKNCQFLLSLGIYLILIG